MDINLFFFLFCLFFFCLFVCLFVCLFLHSFVLGESWGNGVHPSLEAYKYKENNVIIIM